jgi:hypothetical protein
MFQHEISLHNMLKMQREGSRFWGEGWDAVLKLYAMYNQVKSDYDVNRDGTYGAKEPYGGVRQGARQADLITPGSNWTQYAANYWAAQGDNYSDHSKLKFGADLFGNFLPVMGAGVRFDRVAPNSNISDQTFMILSPRLEFRSKWVTREKITLQYSRYMYAQRECATMGNYNPYLPLSGSEDFDHTGSPQNFTGSPVNQECVQLPSGPRLPDGWGASSLETPDNWRGAPIGGGNPNAQRPDVNVVQISASMWW